MKWTAGLVGLTLLASNLHAEENSMNWADHLGTDIEDQWQMPEHRAFDFWIGDWHANWRDPLEGQLGHEDDGDWTHQYVFPTLGGKAIVEMAEPGEITPEEAQPHGFSIRYFDVARDKWVMAQHWPSPSSGGIAFLDQLIGTARHGRREVFSHIARPNASGGFDYRRYVFSDIRHEGFRWDGSNSSDEGVSWTTWNVVEFHRQADFPDLSTPGSDLPTYHNGLLCTDEPARSLDGLAGQWSGEVTSADGSTSPATFSAGRLLDGCAVAGMIEVPSAGYMLFTAWSYTPHFERWVNMRLDNAHGTAHEYRVSEGAQASTFTTAPDLAIVDEYAQIQIATAFDTDASLTRTVIDEISDNALTFRDQTRATLDAPLTDEWVYRFRR